MKNGFSRAKAAWSGRKGNGNGIGEEIRKDPQLFDIVKILKGDQKIKEAVYDFLVANKGLERATKFVKSVVSKNVEESLAAEISEDPKISDIVNLLKKNPETKDTVLQLLETDMEIIRSLLLLKKHLKGNRSGILSKNANSIYF